jgi:uncharacterized membrane protein
MTTHEGHLANKWTRLGREKLGSVLNREKLGSVNVGKTERWASVLGGAALAALALRRGQRKSAVGLAALAGLPLLWRGTTGHCPVYEKMGIDRTRTTGAGTSLASEHTGEPLTATDLHPIGQSF